MPVPQSQCPACHTANRSRLPVYHRWNGVAWWHIRCPSCRHRYTDPMPTDDELARMYDRAYFEAGGAWVCGFWAGSYADNEAELREEARGALRALPVRSGRLLEVGAAGGFFLDEARAQGFQVVGCELNADQVAFARDRLGLDMREGLFEQIPLAPGSFDVVVAQDVLEHTRDPRAFVRHAATLLAPGGVLFIRGPLEDELRVRMYQTARILLRRGEYILDEPPFHLQGFTRRSFERIVTDAGLRPQSFTPGAARETITNPLEWVTFQLDRLRGGGNFMIATAVRQPLGRAWG